MLFEGEILTSKIHLHENNIRKQICRDCTFITLSFKLDA